MKDDDFLTQLKKSPRPEFAEQLYRRINKPMNTTTSWAGHLKPQRIALALTILILLISVTLLLSPAARAFAGDILRQIGAISVAPISSDSPVEPNATAAPPQAGLVQSAENSAKAAELAGFELFTPTYLPEGYLPSDNWSIIPQGEGVIVARKYHSGDNFLFFNAFRYGPNDLYDQGITPNESPIEVTVRGNTGLWITGRLMARPDKPMVDGTPELLPTSWLLWEEDGVNYTLFGDNLSREEALRVAEGLSQ